MSNETTYYLSERRRRRGRRLSPLSLFLLILLVFLLLVLLFNNHFSSLIRTLGESAARNRVEEIMNRTLYGELMQNSDLYENVIKLRYKEDGTVASLETKTAKLIKMRANLLSSMLTELSEPQNLTVHVPVSALFGLDLLPAGSSFTFNIRTTRDVNAYFESEFSETGINQTLHRILFTVSLRVVLLFPGGSQTIETKKTYPFAETILVGTVPDAYTKIDRLTDDITETELDDIYDFGAHQN